MDDLTYTIIIIFSLVLVCLESKLLDNKTTRTMSIYTARKTTFGQHFKVYFKKRSGGFVRPLGEPVIVTQPRFAIIPLVFFSVCSVGLIYLYLEYGIIGMIAISWWAGLTLASFLLIPLGLLWFYARIYTSRVYVYQNCIIIKNCFKKHMYYYNQLDSIESDIRIRKNFGRGSNATVYLIYNLKSSGYAVVTLHSNHYKNLTDLETVFTEKNPCVNYVINTGLE